MTVRTWFRLLRAQAWDNGLGYGVMGVELYLRNETPDHLEPGPLKQAIRIHDLRDIQELIHKGPPPKVEYFRYHHWPSAAITH